MFLCAVTQILHYDFPEIQYVHFRSQLIEIIESFYELLQNHLFFTVF